jgi:light-regulated signal transduction histidine kinase (bacteriophytochrome)
LSSTPRGSANNELAAYMDILSHDMLNNNQAILSCIEFIAASSVMDGRSKEYAARAAAKVNISTLMFESIRGLCLANRSEMPPLAPMDLADLLTDSVQALERFFPNAKAVLPDCPGTTLSVLGNDMARDLVLMAMVNLALLAKAEGGRIDIRLEERQDHVDIVISSGSVRAPPALLGNDLPHITTDSRSKMVRIAGFLLARLMAKALEGDFEVKAGTDIDPNEGCTTTISLRREVG